MAKNNEKQDGPNIVNTTSIGNVIGPVHTGSGDIHIGSFNANSAITSKDDFLSALTAIKSEMEAAKEQGLSPLAVNQATAEIESAAQEAKAEKPKAGGIVERLEKAKSILVSGAGVAAAATTAVTAVGKLVPFIDTVIKSVGHLFS